MTGDSKGATDALEEAYKTADQSQKGDIAYMLGHLYYSNRQNDKAFQYFDSIKDQDKFSSWYVLIMYRCIIMIRL
jgi:uncharacterized protein HemY